MKASDFRLAIGAHISELLYIHQALSRHFSSNLPDGPRTQQQLLSNRAGPNFLIDGEKMLRDTLAPVRIQGPCQI